MGTGEDGARGRARRPAQILLPVHVPLPLRQAAHGARAQLHDRRCAVALSPHEGVQRAAADGLGRIRPAGGERGHGERRAASQMDQRQHRLHEEAAQVARLRHRLGAGARDLSPRLLPVEPVAVPAPAGARPGVPGERSGELGSGGSDGARQRAGDRRARVAHRRNGREARDPDVLHAHHRIRRRVAGSAPEPARVARARESDAGELDRPQRRRGSELPIRGWQWRAQGVHDSRRHAVRSDLLRGSGGA